MAVQVFKDGASTFIDPIALQDHLNAGWSVNDPNAPLPPGIKIINEKPKGEAHVVVPPVEVFHVEPQKQKRKYTKRAKA